MKTRFHLLLLLVVLFSSCAQNAITGRKQWQFFSEADIQSTALTQYRDFISKNKVVPVSGSRDAAMVSRLGQKLTTAITAYYKKQGLGAELEGYQWEYNLVDDKQANAWCMPGGKIVVYTGLLPYTKNETALAIVMGHEIAHALAKHGNERMSQSAVQQVGGVALQIALLNKSPEAQNIFLNAYGIGTTVGGLLPFSRKHELEADKLGLMYAAMAGYDPRESVLLWERMAQSGDGNKPPEILSTHPAEATRIEKLKEEMPEALKLYEASRGK